MGLVILIVSIASLRGGLTYCACNRVGTAIGQTTG